MIGAGSRVEAHVMQVVGVCVGQRSVKGGGVCGAAVMGRDTRRQVSECVSGSLGCVCRSGMQAGGTDGLVRDGGRCGPP